MFRLKRHIGAALKRVGLLEAVLLRYQAAKRYRPGQTARNRAYLQAHPQPLSLPPRRLLISSTGNDDIAWFLEGGKAGAEVILATLEKNGISGDDRLEVLDFGCGCGRVLRHLATHPWQLHGVDYNAAAVRWCRQHLPIARFDRNGLAPPLTGGAERFDLVYAFSVFTHFTAALQHAWMAELRRILRPGGHLLASFHGDAYRSHLAADELAQLRRDGLFVRDLTVVGTNLCGAYHTEAYIRSQLAVGFEVRDYQPRGARGNPEQDLVLFRRV